MLGRKGGGRGNEEAGRYECKRRKKRRRGRCVKEYENSDKERVKGE
jgi:hypothetical protein